MAKILIVEDSPSALSLMEFVLNEAGHEVTGCLAATDALKLLTSKPLDLIITDIYMPEMDGLEFLAQARKISALTPVIVISGIAGNKSMLKTAMLLGAAYSVQKPFSKQELLEAVNAVLKKSTVSTSEKVHD